MKHSFFIILFSAGIFMLACNAKPEVSQGYDQSNLLAMEMTEPEVTDEKGVIDRSDNEIKYDKQNESEALNPSPVVDKKKIIKDGNISVKTNDLEASKQGIDNLLKKLNAYYEREELQNNDQTIFYNLKIRIPAQNFEKLISGIESGKDEVMGKSIYARDVTEEYVDIETRLANKREYLRKYKELLNKASSVKDILDIEENIRTLQEEIESKEGRLKYLNDQIAFSTLSLNVYKEKEYVYKPQPQDKFTERVKNSLSNGWTAVVNFVLWSITIWPFYVVIILVIVIIRRIRRKRKNPKS